MKKTIFTILRIVITILLLYLIFRHLNIKVLKSSLTNLNMLLYLLGALLIVINTFLLTLRIYTLFSVFDNKPNYFETLKYYLIGLFFNQTLPTSVGGDSVKGYFMGKKVNNISKGILLTFIDRIIGLITMLFYLFIAIIVGGIKVLEKRELIYLLIVVVLMIIAIVLIFSHKFSSLFYKISLKRFEEKFEIIKKIKEAYKFFLSTRSKKRIYFTAMFYSLLAQTMLVLSGYFIGKSLGINNVVLVDYFIILPIIFVVSMIPISIGGFGVREGTFVWILSRYGVSNEKSLSLSLLYIFIFIVISLFGGGYYLTLKKEH